MTSELQCLTQLFDQVTEMSPDAVCLVDDHRELTYREVRTASAALAGRLLETGVRTGDRVGLLLGRSHWTVVSILAVLRCGATYVPLDPDYPDERLRFVSEDADIRFVVGDRAAADRLGRPAITVVGPDEAGGTPPVTRPDASDAAYVIYTSGSTGRPKGCVVTHGNVLALLRGALPLFDFGSDDRWSLFHSPSFDFSVWEMWGALATGASIVVVPTPVARQPYDFLDFLVRQRITVLNQVPSVFRSLVTAYLDDEVRRALAVRHLVFGGESVDLDVVRAFLDTAPHPPVAVNMYGITEITVHATIKVLTRADLDGDVRSPIGRPLPHLAIDLRDDNGDLVPDGEIGEMWVSGDGVAAGYHDRPELTARRFVTVDGVRHYRSGDLARRLPGGDLEYLGRNDQQVKLRGFRVEPGEIEATLRTHDDVLDVAVTIVANAVGAQFLVACVVVADHAEDIRTTLRNHARTTLPAHMVPDRYVTVDALPLTASGKLDRAALPELVVSRRAAAAR